LFGPRTISDENRHITFCEDYADGQFTKTRSVSFSIDSVKIDEGGLIDQLRSPK